MSNVRFALHAMFPAGITEVDVDLACDDAAAAVGLSFVGVERDAKRTSRNYRDANVEPLGFSYTLESPCQTIVSTGYYRPGLEPYAPPRVADMFTRICVAVDADLGRSDLGGGYGLVRESELDGPLEFIDWYQYIGPRSVERIGADRLLASPAFQVTTLESGAIVLMLAPSPWDEGYSRTKVADHLGITLRPCTARNPKTGEPIVINWG